MDIQYNNYTDPASDNTSANAEDNKPAKIKYHNYIEFAKLDNLSLLDALNEEYTFTVPEDVDSIPGMKKASLTLRNVTNSTGFITSALSYTVVMKRVFKNKMDKAGKGTPEYEGNKQLYEMLVDKEQVFKNHLAVMNDVKQTTSRMITIKQEINKELMMTDGIGA